VKKEYKKIRILSHGMDYSFIIKFENYLRKVRSCHYQRNLQHNAVMKNIRTPMENDNPCLSPRMD